jgi:hypothetical protein
MRARLTFFALIAACASGPIPTGEKPIWVLAPISDLRFPPDRFICAVGTTSVGNKPAPELLASADASARAAVAAALQGAVGRQVAQDFDLAAGAIVQGIWREGDTAYAWGVLDKSRALALQRGKVAEREKLARDLLAQGEAAEAAGAPADALRGYARARTEADVALSGVMLLRALGGRAEAGDAIAKADARMSALLEKLVLTVVEGDRQRVAPGKALAQPVVFTAWIAGKRAAGLPFAVTVPGGHATAVTVSADGRAEVRVDDIGKFEKPEQEVRIDLDWQRLLGEKAPAWISGAPKAGITAVALKKAVETTRVLVLINEKLESGGPVSGAPAGSAVTSVLQHAGFEVQDAKPIVTKFGAERLARLSDAQVKEAARGRADVVVIGTISGGRPEVRAIDVASGQIIFQSPASDAPGPGALEALAPEVEKALRAAVAGP